MKLIYQGGPCTCHPGRYIRYIIPRVPGCRGEISCRDAEAAREGIESHDIPAGAVIALHVPEGVSSTPDVTIAIRVRKS